VGECFNCTLREIKCEIRLFPKITLKYRLSLYLANGVQMDIEIEDTKKLENLDKIFQTIEQKAKETFEPLGMEIKHIAIKTK